MKQNYLSVKFVTKKLKTKVCLKYTKHNSDIINIIDGNINKDYEYYFNKIKIAHVN